MLGLKNDHQISLALKDKSDKQFSHNTFMEIDRDDITPQNLLSKLHIGWMKAFISFIRH